MEALRAAALEQLQQGSAAAQGSRRPLVRKGAGLPRLPTFNPQFEEEFAPGKDFDPDRRVIFPLSTIPPPPSSAPWQIHTAARTSAPASANMPFNLDAVCFTSMDPCLMICSSADTPCLSKITVLWDAVWSCVCSFSCKPHYNSHRKLLIQFKAILNRPSLRYRERAAHKRLKRAVQKEKRGAMRELRKDSAFLDAAREKVPVHPLHDQSYVKYEHIVVRRIESWQYHWL